MATQKEVNYWKEMLRKEQSAFQAKKAELDRIMGMYVTRAEDAKTARAIADGLQWEIAELKAENEKLRELCKGMSDFVLLCCGECDVSDISSCTHSECDAKKSWILMQELRIEAPE